MTAQEAVRSDGSRALRLTNNYGDTGINGNLLAHFTNTGAQEFNWDYRYDAANRLTVAAEGTTNFPALDGGTCTEIAAIWCLRFGNDGFNNAWNYDKTGIAAGLTVTSATQYLVGATPGSRVNNRLLGFGYDAAGNQLQINLANGNIVADYDAENRAYQVRDNSTGLPVGGYSYDGEGRRVSRTAGGITTYYVYGPDGKLLQEYEAGGSTGEAGTQYLLRDQLGSVRVKLDAQNQVLVRHDYEPYGVEIARARSTSDARSASKYRAFVPRISSNVLKRSVAMRTILAGLMASAVMLAQPVKTEITKATTKFDDSKPNSAEVPEVVSISGQLKRVVVLRFKYETDLLGGIERAVKEQKIQNGTILSGVGSVRNYHIHSVSNRTFPSKNIYVKDTEAPADIVSMNGFIIDGKVHCHMTMTNSDKAFGGHLEPGTNVFTFAILTIGVFDDGMDLKRADDKTFR